MSKLQTYISERKKLFREKFPNWIVLFRGKDEALPIVYKDIESFNEETIEGCMAIVRGEINELSAGENGNGYSMINKEKLLQALNTKE